MVFVNYVCPLVVLVSFHLEKAVSVPVIKSYPQDLTSKLDSVGNINVEPTWLHQPRLMAALIDTGDLVYPVSSPTNTMNQPTSGTSDKTRGTSDKTQPNSDKTRTNFDKTRDSLKSANQPKRRDESKPVQAPPGLSPELFELFHQYHQLTRPSAGSGVHITIFPSRSGKQFRKIDAVQKIVDSRDEDDGNVQKIDRKLDSDEKMFDLEEFVEGLDRSQGGESEDLNDAAENDSLDDMMAGNRTDASSNEADEDEDEHETIMQKIRQTDFYAVIYLGAFVSLVTCFFFLACSELFCRNCIDTSNVFLPETHINESYYRTYHPKPSTPPPPYHLFAPPMYKDIVKDIDSAQKTVTIVQCACPSRTPCPPYRREVKQQQGSIQEETSDIVSIIHIGDACPPYQVTPAAAAYFNLLTSDTSPGSKPSNDAATKETTHIANTADETVKATGEIYEIHRVPTEPVVCACRKQDSESHSPNQSENIVKHSVSFICTSDKENTYTLKNSVSFSDQRYVDGQNQFTIDEKPPRSHNQSNCDLDELSTSIEKVNDTERSALSLFMKDNKEFKNQLKTRIRNSVSFSSSPNTNCSDQLDKQCKHSISYTEQIDKAFATMDDLTNRTNLHKHQHSSCFAFGSLHHSIPELIKLSDDKVRISNNCCTESSHQHQRTEIHCSNTIQENSNALSKESHAGNLFDISCIRLLGSPPVQEDDYNNAFSSSNRSAHKTDIDLNYDVRAREQRTGTCDQATNTCSTLVEVKSPPETADEKHAENLKTKIFFINDLDDEDNDEIS